MKLHLVEPIKHPNKIKWKHASVKEYMRKCAHGAHMTVNSSGENKVITSFRGN